MLEVHVLEVLGIWKIVLNTVAYHAGCIVRIHNLNELIMPPKLNSC